jgi:putative ABC transport system substrate-binding protein
MRRRDFLGVLGGVAVPARSMAVQAQKIGGFPTVGVLWHAGSAEEEATNFTALMEGFTSSGYVEGRNINFAHRFPNEVPERFRAMAAELVSLNVDVLVAVGNIAAPYAKNATTTIPVVFSLVGDPIGLKLVDNLARPQGNVTGLSNFSAELIPKRLELLKEMIPELARVAVLANANASVSRRYIVLSHAAATQLGLTVQIFEVRSPKELEAAFDAMVDADMQALTANADGLAFTHRALIAKLALAHRLPLAVWTRDTLEAGALMSYGTDNSAICRRTAVYVDRILKGVKPSELPVEQPTKFQFLINLKTAKALGLDIPLFLQQRADQLIE